LADTSSAMELEAAEAPCLVRALLAGRRSEIAALAAVVRNFAPVHAMTCARGSSDNVAMWFAYHAQIELGLPVASFPPSVASIYNAPLRAEHALFLALSQSGQSPDLVASARAAREGGALTLALLNNSATPLGDAVAHAFNIGAGTETSVAGTKSVLVTMVTALALVRQLSGTPLSADLPDLLDGVKDIDWSIAVPSFAKARSALVIGRGPGLAIAQEVALKLRECCRIDAHALSAAEMRHGPLAAVQAGLPIIVIGAPDAGAASLKTAIALLQNAGANVFAPAWCGGCLPVMSHADPAFALLAQLQTAYRFVAQLAKERGCNPDRPPFLVKVTETE
jgi:glutamine---fructose-6-phosphate transaminase (isomerizing)